MLDLFGNNTDPPVAKQGKGRLAERLHKMLLSVHGKRENDKCGNCVHIKIKRGSSNWYKCSKATLNGGLSTDWKCKWMACGLFEQELKEKK